VGAPVPAQVELGCLVVAADVQLGEVTIVGRAHDVNGVAPGGECGLHSVDHLPGAAGDWGEQVDVLRRPAQQACAASAFPPANANPCAPVARNASSITAALNGSTATCVPPLQLWDVRPGADAGQDRVCVLPGGAHRPRPRAGPVGRPARGRAPRRSRSTAGLRSPGAAAAAATRVVVRTARPGPARRRPRAARSRRRATRSAGSYQQCPTRRPADHDFAAGSRRPGTRPATAHGREDPACGQGARVRRARLRPRAGKGGCSCGRGGGSAGKRFSHHACDCWARPWVSAGGIGT
jgi:hypothetical protein